MGKGLNKVMLIGRIQPNDPELRYTQSGQPVCTFKLVTDDSYKDKEGNMVDRSEWHNIVVWGKPAEIINQYMKKGRQIYLEGKIQSRKYDDKDGQTRYITEINVQDFAFLDSGRGDGDGASHAGVGSGGAVSESSYQSAPAVAASQIQDDDLPF
jgi:single-strand DNA-binding protein